ncbi:MAG: hypothetical protein IPK26_17985 [Planctomycetes bacterium]|nr:hypothetical protein [Planctomycetota bacterium]
MARRFLLVHRDWFLHPDEEQLVAGDLELPVRRALLIGPARPAPQHRHRWRTVDRRFVLQVADVFGRGEHLAGRDAAPHRGEVDSDAADARARLGDDHRVGIDEVTPQPR